MPKAVLPNSGTCNELTDKNDISRHLSQRIIVNSIIIVVVYALFICEAFGTSIDDFGAPIYDLEDIKLKLENDKLEYEMVKTLFDYTKFHIGIYVSLGTILATLLNANFKILPHRKYPLGISIIFIAVAGFAGGVIASTLPECRSLDQFFKMNIAPLDIEELMISGRCWTRIEHTTFWIGTIFGIVAFFFPPKDNKPGRQPAVISTPAVTPTNNGEATHRPADTP
jgi:hypothetical protein